MNLKKSTLLLAAALGLAACGEAQLNGPVAGADIFVDLLGEEGAQYQFTRTSDEEGTRQEVGAEKWEGWGSRDKFAWIGNFDLDSAFVDQARLYLIEARNGSDVDFDKDGEYDSEPSEILGRWRAIVEGSALRSGDASVNLLTESIYQFLQGDIEQLNEDEIRAWLDALAAEVVTDLNGDGVVDYADVMEWSNSRDAEGFTGDQQALEQLAEAIANSAGEGEIHAAAMQIWESLGINPEDFRGRFAAIVDGLEEGDGSGRGSFIKSFFEQLRAASDGGGFGGGENPLEQFFGSREPAGENEG